MSTVVSVSLPEVVESLLAGAAVAAVGSERARPALFTPDHAPALRMACRDAFRAVALQMAPYLDNVRADGDTPELHFASELRLSAALVGAVVADVVAARVLHLMLASSYPALSAAYASQASQTLGTLHRIILSGAPGRVRPHA